MKVNRKQTFVFRRCDFVMPFLINYFKKHKSVCIFWLVFRCILVAKKENLTGFLTGLTGLTGRLDRPVKESRPDRFPSLISAFCMFISRIWVSMLDYLFKHLSIRNANEASLKIQSRSLMAILELKKCGATLEPRCIGGGASDETT